MNLRKHFSTLFLTACTVCSLSISTFAQETKPPAQHRITIGGRSYAYKLTSEDFAGTPSWNQDEGEPPLSVGRAVTVARENLSRFVKYAESWKVRMITLQSMGENKWYYQVHFFCLGVACREIEDRSFMAIVKMDGTLVEPKKVTIEN